MQRAAEADLSRRPDSPRRTMFPARSAVRRVAFAVSAVAVAAATLAGCSSAGSPSAANAGTDSISYALPPDFTPNWILPIGAPGKAQHEQWFDRGLAVGAAGGIRRLHRGRSTGTRTRASRATSQFNAAGTEATDHTRQAAPGATASPSPRATSSSGSTSIEANKKNWGNYNPGQAPDNWTKLTIVDDTHFTITFDKAVQHRLDARERAEPHHPAAPARVGQDQRFR